MEAKFSEIKNCKFGKNVRIVGWANLYDSDIGDDVSIGPFVEIGGASIGARTRISSHTYICPGVSIGEDCFVAHGVMFTNDLFVDAPSYPGKDFVSHPTKIGNRVRIGSGSTILPVCIGDDVIIGAGSTVVKDVPSGTIIMGVAAK